MAQHGAVLVVDDEIAPRESLRMILHPLYQVFTAADGKEALACLQSQEIDLVTLDMKMPEVSGIEVLKEIRKIKADVDVIIISGYMNQENTQEAKSIGAAEVINKPFNVTDIIASVGKFVEKRKYHQKVKTLYESVKSLGVMDEDQLQRILYN